MKSLANVPSECLLEFCLFRLLKSFIMCGPFFQWFECHLGRFARKWRTVIYKAPLALLFFRNLNKKLKACFHYVSDQKTHVIFQLCPVLRRRSTPTHCCGLRICTISSLKEHTHRIKIHHTCGLIFGSPNNHVCEIKNTSHFLFY